MQERPLIVGIGGTTRRQSTTEWALRASLVAAEAAGARSVRLSGADIDLPVYRPEDPDRTPAARRLVEQMARADGLIVASPGYHGGLSGHVKNALDYAEDLRDRDPPYWEGRAVGCLVCAYGWQATTTTLVALRSVTHALRGWPTPLGVGLNSREPVFDPDGNVVDEPTAERLRLVARQVVEFALQRRADLSRR